MFSKGASNGLPHHRAPLDAIQPTELKCAVRSNRSPESGRVRGPRGPETGSISECGLFFDWAEIMVFEQLFFLLFSFFVTAAIWGFSTCHHCHVGRRKRNDGTRRAGPGGCDEWCTWFMPLLDRWLISRLLPAAVVYCVCVCASVCWNVWFHCGVTRLIVDRISRMEEVKRRVCVRSRVQCLGKLLW